VANTFGTINTKFYQNQSGFVDGVYKNILVCFFGSQFQLQFTYKT